jgi:hypothetical protein
MRTADTRRGWREAARMHHPKDGQAASAEVCRGSHFCTPSFCRRGSGYLLPHCALWPNPGCGCGCGRGDRSGNRRVRVEAAHDQPEAVDRSRHRQLSRHMWCLPVRAGDSQQRACGTDAEFPADPGHAADGLCWPGCGREQGRSAEPGSAGRNFWRREAGQEKLQDSRHQRDHHSSAIADAAASTSCSVCRKLRRSPFRLWKTIFPRSAKST